jgi:hypothetical protein
LEQQIKQTASTQVALGAETKLAPESAGKRS